MPVDADNDMTSFIKEFLEISKSDVGIAGGKGASLGEMTQAGIPVPPGFVAVDSCRSEEGICIAQVASYVANVYRQ